ncbi:MULTISPECIES: T9SS type A sorting domain-containing protein [Flavobacterium]|uniref:T9SS type A sorting domain-containing protein n=1 Tax=Flavobacterium TaxID=237 RepID=UPI001FCBC15A|nr:MULTISPECIES: T9SS type A sorting domain-containing protein [Flavobacterium]UOK43615.1 T9SS type A sorting domain-containing protein [Flavobacterium enshiense]
MKNFILFQSEEIPESKCRPGFSSNLSKKFSASGYWKTVTALLFAFLLFGNVSWAQNIAADIDQVRNGGVGETPTPNGWTNGNLGPENTHLLEGYSVPYRAIVTGLTAGTQYTIVIGIDTRDQNKAALDYFTHYQRLAPHTQFGHAEEIINPLFGLSGSFSGPVTSAIPVPSNSGTPVAGMPASSFNNLPAGERNFTMWNGTFIGAITYALQDALNAASTKTNIQINFTANASTVVLAWGGHIASNAASEWNGGAHPGGSPYHCRIVGLGVLGGTLSGGSQDRSLKSNAVLVPPTCDATGPTSICGGTSNVYSTPTITGATYLWTLSNNTSGATIPGSATGASVTVNSGAGPGSYTITVVVTKDFLSSEPCPVTTVVNVGATNNAGPDQTLCQTPPSGPTQFTLAGTASGGTSLWTVDGTTGTASASIVTPGSLSSLVNVSGIGTVTLKLTTTSNTTPPCGNDDDTVVLTVNANATADAGPPQTLCQTPPSGPTQFTLAGTASGGTTLWTVDGMTGTASASIVTPGSLSSLVNVSGVGTVTLKLTTTSNTTPPCANADDTVVLTVNANATADAGPPQTLCQTPPSGPTQFTLAGSASGGTTLWTVDGTTGTASASIVTPGSLSSLVNVSGIGTVTLKLTTTSNTTPPCANADDTVVLTVNANATADAGPPQDKCQTPPSGPTQFTLAGSASGGTTLWTVDGTTGTASASIVTPGSLSSLVNVSGVGTVTLKLTTTSNTTPPCANADDTVVLTVNEFATADAGPDQTLCQTQPDGPTSFTLAGTSSGGTTLWEQIAQTGTAQASITTPASLTSGVSVSGVGTVTLKLTTSNALCGNDDDTVVLTVEDIEATCPGNSTFTVICTDTAAENAANLAAAWAAWVAGFTYSPLNPAPTVTLTYYDVTIEIVNGVPTEVFTETADTTPPSLLAGGTKAIKIEVETALGCKDECQAKFTVVNPCAPACDATPNDVLCFGGTGSITVVPGGPVTPYIIRLFSFADLVNPLQNLTGLTSNTNVTFENLPAGTYRVRVIDGIGAVCEKDNLVIDQPDSALNLGTLTPSPASCGVNDGTIVVTLISGGTPPYTIKLDNGTAVSPNGAGGTSHTFTGVAAGPHTVTVYDANYAQSPGAGCTDSDTVTIDALPCGGHIFPTQTACCNIVAGNATELENVCYTAANGKVSNAIPGVFFYYTKLIAPSSSFTLNVVQTKSCGTFNYFQVQGNKDIKLFGPNCTRLSTVTVSASNGQAQMMVTGATAGTEYVLGVKYDVKSLIASTYVGSAPTCTYDFVTTIGGNPVAGSDGSIDAVPGCSDNTPLPPACTVGDQVVNNAPVPSDQPIETMFKAYPVPFRDYVNIRYEFNYHSKARIEIYDAKGMFVKAYDDADAYFNKEVRLDVDFTQGDGQMYIIKVITDNEVGTKRIISKQ